MNQKIKCRVRASVYPTSHNKIWLSSGRFSLHNNHYAFEYLNLTIGSKRIKEKMR